MARVERFTAGQPVPVERAQLIDPSAFRFSTAGAEMLEQVGGILEELGRRKVGMQDRISISNINAAVENAEREYQKEIIGKPLEEHAAILVKHRNNAMAFAGQQRLSADARKLAENKLQIWGDTFADTGELATIKALERDAIIRVTADYEKALTEGIREDITEAETALDEQFKISYAPAEAKVLKGKAEQRAIRQMEENAISNVYAAIEAASEPETGTGDFTLARELAKNPLIPEPRQASLRTAIKTAESIYKNKQKTLTDIYTEQAHKSAVTGLVENINNVDFINNLPEPLKEYWQEKLDKRATSLEKGEDTFSQYDPILYNGLKQQIRETPDKVDYMDIIDSVGNGLTPLQGQELFELQDKMQQKDNPLAQSHIKRAHDRINDLQNAQLTVKGIEPPTAKSAPEEIIEYMNVFDEMHEAIDRNTELKPTEMRQYTEEMARPLAEESVTGWLKNWWPETLFRLRGGTLSGLKRIRVLRTQPASRDDFESKFKELYKLDPDMADEFWDRWEKEW